MCKAPFNYKNSRRPSLVIDSSIPSISSPSNLHFFLDFPPSLPFSPLSFLPQSLDKKTDLSLSFLSHQSMATLETRILSSCWLTSANVREFEHDKQQGIRNKLQWNRRGARDAVFCQDHGV